MIDMEFRPVLRFLLVVLMLTLGTGPVWAEGKPPDAAKPAVDGTARKEAERKAAEKEAEKAVFAEVEALKKDIVELNQELYRFEEELLYPANSQIAVFLSFEPKTGFVLDSIELQINERMVTSHLYTENEIVALKRGGVQRLYIGSLSDGEHKISVQVNGLGANNRYFRNRQRASIVKENSARYIELVIGESGPAREPAAKIKQW
jgi:hypothetical protein